MGTVLDFLWKLFGEQYYLCYVESKAALVVLSLPTLYLLLVIANPSLAGVKSLREKLEKWRRESVAGGRFKGIRNFLRYWTTIFCINRAAFVVTCLALLLGWHWLFSSLGEEFYLRFGKDKFGILVTRFTGADLTGRFGPLGLREKVAASINYYSDSKLRHDYVIRFSNREFRDEESAKEYAKTIGAQMAIWGYGEQSGNTLAVCFGFTLPRWLEITPSHKGDALCRIEPESQKTLTDEKGPDWLASAIAEWVDFIAVYSLIAASVHANDYDATIKYVKLAAGVRENPDASDLLLRSWVLSYCATAKEDWATAVVASQTVDSLLLLSSTYPRPIRSGVLYGKGAARLMLGDTVAAIPDLAKAIELDSTNDLATSRLAHVLITRLMVRQSVERQTSPIEGGAEEQVFQVRMKNRDYLQLKRLVELTLQRRPRDSVFLQLRDALNTGKVPDSAVRNN